jgi:hypothetical protein
MIGVWVFVAGVNCNLWLVSKIYKENGLIIIQNYLLSAII